MIDSSAPNQPAQNYEIVNPALELQVATLLPSVAGYGGNLRSTNTIVPIVDLTAAAEGSGLPESLQQAWDFSTGSAAVNNTTTTLITNTGFWKVNVNMMCQPKSTAQTNKIFIDDGSSTATVWQVTADDGGTGSDNPAFTSGIFIVYLRAGMSLKATAGADGHIDVWYRQVADISGTLTQPLNFS